MKTAVVVALEMRFSFLTPLTYFEIRVLCEAQNRGARPYFGSHRSHSRLRHSKPEAANLISLVSQLM